MKKAIFPFLLLLLSIFLFSCAQDPIFFNISIEPEPKDPMIPGTPTNIVVHQGRLYTGTFQGQRIFSFPTNGRWSEWSRPGGSLGELASDGTYLYALVFPTGNPLEASEIRYYSDGAWHRVNRGGGTGSYSIQTLYGAGGTIFAGGQIRHSNSVEYAILHVVNTGSSYELQVLMTGTHLLRGAAERGGTVYLATAGDGIINASGLTRLSGTAGAVVTGIIHLGTDINPGAIAAVTTTGSGQGSILISTDGTSFTSWRQDGFNFTGGMAIWRDPNNGFNPALLLLGIRNRGFSLSHGYREMALDSNGVPLPGLHTPGDYSPSSVADRPRYAASLGNHPVHAIIQVPHEVVPHQSNVTPLIFAATSVRGLWSYRDGQWNAED
ncbi:MAG: hypothetical protein FWH12_09175 [Treponema sp.]|nr:hypothetical protein [Treponema sp.]